MPNFSFLGSIIKKKYPKVVDSLKLLTGQQYSNAAMQDLKFIDRPGWNFGEANFFMPGLRLGLAFILKKINRL